MARAVRGGRRTRPLDQRPASSGGTSVAALGLAALAMAALGFTVGAVVFLGGDRLKETTPVALARAFGDTRNGRNAAAPHEIPPRGWLAIAKRVILRSAENRLMQEAAAVTFYTLLATFPALTATVSLYGLFADPEAIQGLIDTLKGIIPDGGLALLHGQAQALIGNGARGLTTGFAIGLAITLWSANQGSKALFDALNIVYREEEKRSYPYFVLVAFAFTFGAILFVIAAMVAVVALPDITRILLVTPDRAELVGILRWPVILVAFALFVASLYRFGPSRENAKWRWVSWGGAAAAVGWVAVSFAFSWYVQHFGSFDKTYGSLGAAVGFMMWIWISTLVVLIGAQVNSEMEHQTAADTTTGGFKPLGLRGAAQADTVA